MTLIQDLEVAIAHTFSKLGRFIGHNPLIFIFIMSVSTLLSWIALFNFDEANNVRTEYSPLDAPSRAEYAVAQHFLGQNGSLDPVYMMVETGDGGSMLRDKYRYKLADLIKKVQRNITTVYKGHRYRYTDICEPYCELNTAFKIFLEHYNETRRSSYTYPTIELFGTQAFIGNNAYGVEYEKNTSIILSFTTAVLQFFVVAPENDRELLYTWQMQIQEHIKNEEYDIFKIGITSDTLVSSEVRRMGIETAPVLIASFIGMIFFVIISSFRQSPLRSKPWESIFGCTIPIITLVTATSVLSALNIKFQSIAVASFFLILSVGIDDVFIILRAWDRTNPNLDIPERMSKTLEDAGPSVTISSITNALSFAIGILSKTPAVRTFCIYSCIAIILCYLYQLILFTAVLALSGRREKNSYQSFLCCRKANPQARNHLIVWLNKLQIAVIKKWSRIISSWPARLILVFILGLYYHTSIIGIQKIEAKISIDKMALPDSYLRDFQCVFEKALRNMQPITVFIMNPGDLRDPERMNGIKAIVEEFEHCIYSYGNKSTFFWLTQYEEFLRFYSETGAFNYMDIPAFLRTTTYFYLSSFMRMNQTACYEDSPECVSAFFFITNFHEVIKFNEMVPAVLEWRQIAAKYSDYQVYPFSEHSPFVDQTMSIESTVLWSVVAALFCTAAACFIFIPSWISITCALYSVFSMSIGIFGILSHWGVDLDPLSMVALLMAIGFSVDFTAHISYHYYKANGRTPSDKLEEAFTAIGWPMVQVGVSTIIALLPLYIKQSYLAMVFLKTVIVVVLLGMIHGLIVLPAILTISLNSKDSEKSSAESSERSSQGSHERKDSFYKTENLLNKINREMRLGGKTQVIASQVRKSSGRNVVSPVCALDIVTVPSTYVHRIELGRTNSIS